MKKKILVLMIIGVSCFMLPTCKFNRKKEDKREVIWTDLREDKSYIKIERGYAKSVSDKSIDVTLISNLTKHIYVPNGYSVTSGTQSHYTCVWDFSGPFTANTKKMEIFLFDPVNYEEHDTYYEVKKVEGVLAYTMTILEEETGKIYQIVSKDNLLDKNVDFFTGTGNMEDLLKRLEEMDIAEYTGFTIDNTSYLGPSNGYIIKSKMDGSYIHLDTKIPQLSYWFY